MPSFDIDINFNVNSEGISSAEEQLQGLKDTTDELSESTEEVSTEGVDNLGASADETASNVERASEEMGNLGGQTEETNQKMQETAEASAGIGTALAGIGGAIGLDAMITKADNINTSWNQLSLTFDGTGVSMDTLKIKSSELTAATGRSGSQVRDYFNQMGIAGITNTELLATSFRNMSGRAYQTGTSVENMESAVQRMVMSGNAGARMLSRLGISSSALAEALGVTEEQAASTFAALSTEERLAALNKAMGDGTKANEMYKNSYVGLKEQALISIGGLMSSIGQSILPVVIPAIQAATDGIKALTNTVKGLPQPLMSIFGVFGGGIVIVTTLVGALGTLGKVGSTVLSGLRSLKTGFEALRGAMSTARVMIDAVRNAESISAAVKAVLNTVLGAERVAQIQNTIAKASAIVPTSALAIAENSLLLPILLVIGAIVVLVGVLGYLYNNNETVRQSIDWLIQQFQLFIGRILQVGQVIVSFVSGAISNFLTWVTGGGNAATNLVNTIYNTLTSLPSKVSSAVSGIANILTKPFTDAWNMIEGALNNITDGLNQLNPLSWFGSAEYEGFGNVSYEGFGNDTLNKGVASASSHNAVYSPTFNINGIIEKEAGEYIVGKVNDYVKTQNLIRGKGA